MLIALVRTDLLPVPLTVVQELLFHDDGTTSCRSQLCFAAAALTSTSHQPGFAIGPCHVHSRCTGVFIQSPDTWKSQVCKVYLRLLNSKTLL